MSKKNPISIEVLETLDSIDRRGSFAKAAEELNKATSAVSYSVQKLEEQLDIALFQRQGRRSVLTPAGKLILEEGRHILDHAAQLANRAKEVATGWETHIRIAVEFMLPAPTFFAVVQQFLENHPTIEIDITESVLNGGWEALEEERVDLIVGAPGPVPQQKGYRAIALPSTELVPVIAAKHPKAQWANNKKALQAELPKLRRVVTHDTSTSGITRSGGLGSEGKILYVQTLEQKVEAIVAGIGIGHLPLQKIQPYLDQGVLLTLVLPEVHPVKEYMAWKLANKGRGLRALTEQLAAADWQ
ncbi:LysR family transcriptional regulator [Oceanicoccus sagamiensis]|uniref:LysR family transcriptional regulator n=1 Tax=Oceanicoccus sagamiensis TaxID=716816 RepID=A0A1X9N604_9GAMM|nr:LysR substrate-binding domain-containing protein [Oceanicoccus sagamiensis]ARN73156.1 LysR family transcriptional regulator [Oceanicoccus sagamiensis]